MSTPKKKGKDETETKPVADDFVQNLIKDLNREHQTRVAWNLATDLSPTHVKRWVSTGCIGLDYAVANRRNGGCPEGRIIEIYGPPSIGKSHLAAQICRSAQQMGGIAVYIDTENAVNPENLNQLGVDVSKRFIYVETGCVEDTFTVIESIVNKVKASAKDVPVVVVWDSVAATPAKAELEADYDKDSIGLQARQLSKGFRKITQVIGNQNITLVCLNQIRTKIGCVGPDTVIDVTSSQNLNVLSSNFINEFKERSITISSFFENLLGLCVDDMVVGQPVDVNGFEIRSWNLNTNKEEWCEIKRAVRKEDVIPWIINLSNGDKLSVSPEHRLWAKTEDGAPHWVEAETLGVADATFDLFSKDGWVPATFVRGEQPIKILDIEVDETHAYFSNGVLSHNTMYGDPMTTSGGLALPFHASVRISLTGGARIEDPKTKELIGINVNAYLLKNKVAAPFRKVSFQIHFGKGIVEHEDLFDAVRSYCDDHRIEKDGKLLSISGLQAWKELSVADAKTGEVLINKKFYKAEFGDIMRDPQFKPYVDDIIEAALTRTYEQVKLDHDERLPIDPDGYEVVEPTKAS